ncbi:ABC transporter permease [Vacuolonema iberomarrocanum]|uniref:ABC transporter permease n=1 Tax=Vacuolonema iberomarrocanum TaxID=3454632 RepID=UPI0019DAB917|nr:ABC transporter permease [filamentous cyanobacterium LEGE 07170]
MRRIFAQFLKELSQFQRDRLTVALAFLLPLAVLLIYGYAIRLEAKNIPLSIQDFDNSQLSRGYVERIFASQQFVPAPLLDNDPTLAIDRGIAKATLVIPPDFSRTIKDKDSVEVQVLVDGTDVNNARVIQNGIRATTQFFLRSDNLIPDRPRPQVVAEVRLWFNPGREEAFYIVPGIFGVILWVFPSMLAAIATVREKEQGTIVQIYASDLSAAEWLLGKELAYIAIGIGEALITLVVAALLFGIRIQGDPTPLLVGTIVFLAAAVAFGLFVGVRTGNQTGAVQGTAIAGFLTALLLSGFIYRIDNIPFPLSALSNVIPARYYILITRDALVRGTGWAGVGFAPLAIALIGGFFFFAATRILHRMQFSD